MGARGPDGLTRRRALSPTCPHWEDATRSTRLTAVSSMLLPAQVVDADELMDFATFADSQQIAAATTRPISSHEPPDVRASLRRCSRADEIHIGLPRTHL